MSDLPVTVTAPTDADLLKLRTNAVRDLNDAYALIDKHRRGAHLLGMDPSMTGAFRARLQRAMLMSSEAGAQIVDATYRRSEGE